MLPTFESGNLLITTDSFQYEDLNIGEIVVFRHNIQMIKRIVAKEGDCLMIVDGILYVNNTPSLYQFDSIHASGLLSSPYTVPSGELFCMGDNRNNSIDCRDFGSIKFEQVKFKILRKIF